jgi:transposase
MLPHDLPPWWTVYQQYRRWQAAGVEPAQVTEFAAAIERRAAGKVVAA